MQKEELLRTSFLKCNTLRTFHRKKESTSAVEHGKKAIGVVPDQNKGTRAGKKCNQDGKKERRQKTDRK